MIRQALLFVVVLATAPAWGGDVVFESKPARTGGLSCFLDWQDSPGTAGCVGNSHFPLQRTL